jgi:hypothetical protein
MSSQNRGGGEGSAIFNGQMVQLLIWLAIALAFLEAPCSIFYLFFSSTSPSLFTSSCILAWLEVAFFFKFVLTWMLHFRPPAKWHGQETAAKRQETWKRMVATSETLVDGGIDAWIQTFFERDGVYDWGKGNRRGSSVSLAVMDDCEELRVIIALIFFCKDSSRSREGDEYRCLSPAQKAEIDQMLDDLSKRSPRVMDLLKKERAGNRGEMSKSAQSLKRTRRRRLRAFMKDTMWCWPPGISLYAIVIFLHIGFAVAYWRRGYVRRVAGELVYWMRRSRNGNAAQRKAPTVILPGVGTGLLQYDLLAGLIEKDDESDVFLVELPFISMAFLNWIPKKIGNALGFANAGGTPVSADAFLRDCEVMLQQEGTASGAVFVAHSYGSVSLRLFTLKKN